MVLFEENAADLGQQLKAAQHEIDKLDARCEPLESSVNLLRIDVTSLEREMTKSENHLHELQSFKEAMDVQAEDLEKRIFDLENDKRIDRLEELFPRMTNVERAVQDNEYTNKARLDTCDSKVHMYAVYCQTCVHLCA